jgi:hypothetical protein
VCAAQHRQGSAQPFHPSTVTTSLRLRGPSNSQK